MLFSIEDPVQILVIVFVGDFFFLHQVSSRSFPIAVSARP